MLSLNAQGRIDGELQMTVAGIEKVILALGIEKMLEEGVPQWPAFFQKSRSGWRVTLTLTRALYRSETTRCASNGNSAHDLCP